jgi:hypothetical protein
VAVNACRLVLSAAFVLSGFVKAVDPIGTQYKINDYLEAMGLAQYVPDFATLALSVFLSAVEFSLGVFLLFAVWRRVVAKLPLVVMCIMTPLTLWLAIANPISDCGCFGDAVTLTNWQTFFKNIVLLACAVVVAKWSRDMARLISSTNQWIVLNYTVIFILIISGRSLYALPQFDFRPYHVGADIRKGMEIPPGAPQPQFATTFIMEKNGERREFSLDNYPDSTWIYIDSKTVQTAKGYEPPIHDFSITRRADGEDLTEKVLGDKGYTFLLISPHLEQADDSRLDLINQIYDYAERNGYPFLCLTASGDKGIERWKDLTGAEYAFCTTDATTLQTMIRSNPGLMLLHDGKVTRKWGHNQLPDETVLSGRLENIEAGTAPDETTLHKILNVVLWYVLPLLALTLADRLWAWSRWVRRKDGKKGRD